MGVRARLALATSLLIVSASAASAETYLVYTGADGGPGSLRAAIEAANLTPGPHVIAFDYGTDSVQLATCLPPLLESMAIGDAGGTRMVVIDASLVPAEAYCWGLSLGGYGLASGKTFTVNALHLRGGWGGIWVQDNTVTVRNSIIESRPTAPGTFGGGGIYAYQSELTVEGTLVQGNAGYVGAGVYFDGQSLSIADSRITGNTAYWGGGVFVQNAAASSVVRSTIDANVATRGGGLSHHPTQVGGTLLLENVTLSANHAGDSGGGVHHEAFYAPAPPLLVLRNVTLHANEAPIGAGLEAYGGQVSIASSIIGGNAGGPDCDLLYGAAASGSDNVTSSGGGCTIAGADNVAVGDLRLDVLAVPPYRTIPAHAPLSFSAALGAGRACPAVDQHGATRIPEHCDAGAVEHETLGEQRTLIVMLELSGATCWTPDSPSTAATQVFTGLNDYLLETSYGKLHLTGEVVGPFPIDGSGCDPDAPLSGSTQNAHALLEKALTAASGQVDVTAFDRLFIYHNSFEGCGCHDNNHAEFGFVAPGDVGPGGVYALTGFRGSVLWKPAALSSAHVLYHEFGHNLRLSHLFPLLCRDAQGGRVALSDDCTFANTWGDPNSVMSNVVRPVHYAASHKRQLGWLEPGQAPFVVEGEFDLEPISTPGSGLKSIRLETPASFWWFPLDYVIELRKPIGLDSHPPEAIHGQSVLDGVFLYAEARTSSGTTYALDPPPYTPDPDAWVSGPLAVGTPVVDTMAGLAIEVLWETTTGARVRVTRLRADGEACADAGQCASGACSASYVDVDGDGFGAGTAETRCGPVPPDRAAAGGDCCDIDPRAWPGQPESFDTPRACGGFDFDCSGGDTRLYPPRATAGCVTTGTCRQGRTCTGPYWQTAIAAPACGQSAIWRSCGNVSACNGSGSTCSSYTTTSVTQRCR